MNLKKAKTLRRLIKQEFAARGITPPERGILYRDTKRVAGHKMPQGWIRTNLLRLALNNGPWYKEALAAMIPVYSRTGLNVPGSFRHIYRQSKKVV